MKKVLIADSVHQEFILIETNKGLLLRAGNARMNVWLMFMGVLNSPGMTGRGLCEGTLIIRHAEKEISVWTNHNFKEICDLLKEEHPEYKVKALGICVRLERLFAVNVGL
ncbi:MAG: hypothetical protein NTX72_00720 [Candidatus Uhrbacteria bacterium]|nr:hypothetical protein [Candidatus Uhrbacteria bacterium]